MRTPAHKQRLESGVLQVGWRWRWGWWGVRRCWMLGRTRWRRARWGRPRRNVAVLVLTPTRQPVAEATVTLSGHSAANGCAGGGRLSVPAGGAKQSGGSKAGYVWGAVIARVRADSSNFTQATVLRASAPSISSRAGLEIIKNGIAEVILEPSAFQDAKRRCGLGLDSRHDDSGQCARLWECRAALAPWTLRPTDGAGVLCAPPFPIHIAAGWRT